MVKEITPPLHVALRYPENVEVIYHQGTQQASVLQYNYYADRLAVWGKNLGFLQDQKFMDAYQKGYGTEHNFNRTDPDLRWRGHVYIWAATLAQHLEGDFVECGVNSGIFSKSICEYLDFNKLNKHFFLFDTYEGIPEDQMTAGEKQGMPAWHNKNSYVGDIYEAVKKNFAAYPKAQVIKGKVPDTLPSAAIDKVCYLSIDMGIVYPELETIKYFWDKLTPGAPIVINHYAFGDYKDLQEAYNRFAASHGLLVLTLPTGQGLIIKR